MKHVTADMTKNRLYITLKGAVSQADSQQWSLRQRWEKYSLKGPLGVPALLLKTRKVLTRPNGYWTGNKDEGPPLRRGGADSTNTAIFLTACIESCPIALSS